MTKIKTIYLLITFTILTSCQFVKNSLTFKDKTQDFVENLMKKEYDNCISKMALESEMGQNTNIDTLRLGLDEFRELIERNFGNGNFEYSLMKSEKKFSTIESENTPPNTTLAFVEFSNKNEFGVFKILFDDNSKKIINISTLDVKEKKPNMTLFWLLVILPLGVLIFNIYIVIKIKKSSLSKKWLKYLAVICLNVPTISYAAVSGFSFELISFQILFGVSFNIMGYLGSVWAFGIPLGGLYGFWKLKNIKN